MKLLVDIGNSRIKWSTLSADTLSAQSARSYQNNVTAICETLFQQKSLTHVILIHVLGKPFDNEINAIAKQYSVKLLIVHSELQAYGIKTTYKQPEKLGVDRFVAMIAAHQLNKEYSNKQHCLIIDCGTAVTIDAIDATGKHIGGVILPGLHLCQDSLINKAHNLRQIKQELATVELNIFATTTAQGVKSGCHYSLAATIDKVCEAMEQEIASQHTVKRIICGGDANNIYTLLNGKYELNENLLMQGLQFIANQ